MSEETCAGVPIRFKRRRYGGQTFTWVYAQIEGNWIPLGDPWPCIRPKQSEVAAAIKLITTRGPLYDELTAKLAALNTN